MREPMAMDYLFLNFYLHKLEYGQEHVVYFFYASILMILLYFRHFVFFSFTNHHFILHMQKHAGHNFL